MSRGYLKETFITIKSFLQECCISPTLFTIYVSGVVLRKLCEKLEIVVNDKTLLILFYADDQIVLAEDTDALSYMVRKLQKV